MQKTKSKILTLVFLSAMVFAMIPMAFAVSPSNILINTQTAPAHQGSKFPQQEQLTYTLET